MAITKETENDKIEVVNKWNIQVRTATVIKEDGKEISRNYHRHVLQPFVSSFVEDSDGNDMKPTSSDSDGEGSDSGYTKPPIG